MAIEIGGNLEISGHRVCVVYDGRTGQIVHVHESIAVKGAETLPDDALTTRSLELAGRFVAKTGIKSRPRLESIIVTPEALPQDGPFIVNPKSRELELVRTPARLRSKSALNRKVKRAKPRRA